VIDLSWLTQGVDLPLWAVLSLAGYQRAVAVLRGARSKQQNRNKSSGDVEKRAR